MGKSSAPRLTAVLGPTNTGKTHLAVDRMCAHASGMMGFPLRLLARETFERVLAVKGPDAVALITGEEKILPPAARYFLCTTESMPLDREVAFLAIDEVQMGADPDRGHIFTDRMLHARGYEETMLLGSDTIRPLLRRLLPEAEIVSRPRFSTLSFSGARKLAKLPKRSVIVAFSAEDVYAIAEMVRRHKGGAAVVMGSLSPRTRNAQVALFQSGEVDYLVATDAIGMGLNMDISHVAFAGLHKFDGRKRRRLTVAEMAQIAGRAGRHVRDGTFGVAHLGEGQAHAFEPEEIAAIEGHAFPSLETLRWRNAHLDYSSIPGLLASLDARSPRVELQRPEETTDLAVLRSLAGDPNVSSRARDKAAVARLWSAAQLPDYRNAGPIAHAKTVARLYQHLSEGKGTLPTEWIAGEVTRFDKIGGDIDALADRIAGIRTWTYIANHADWLEDAAYWSLETRRVENRLSDALHERLTQRFVDRRTAVLLRDLKSKLEPVFAVAASGEVSVGGEVVGALSGFRFQVGRSSSHGEKRMVLAAADRGLKHELSRRVAALACDSHAAFTLTLGHDPFKATICWLGEPVARLQAGSSPLSPRVALEIDAATLPPLELRQIIQRLEQWLAVELATSLSPLTRLDAACRTPAAAGRLAGAARGIAFQLVQSLGCLKRDTVDDLIQKLDPADRAQLRAFGVKIGTVHVYLPTMLRPAATTWRLALWAVNAGVRYLPCAPLPGRVSTPFLADAPDGFYLTAGFWPVGKQTVRIDMVERVADAARLLGREAAARTDSRQSSAAFAPPDHLMSLVGLKREDFAELMLALGYRRCPSPVEAKMPEQPEMTTYFQWGQRRPAAALARMTNRPPQTRASDASPFAILKTWKDSRL